MKAGYDFGGYVSKTDVQCTDGTTIRDGAFADMDGKKVPLMWNHQHEDVNQTIGHAILESRPDGTYAYGYLNDSSSAQAAKASLLHGDVDALSVCIRSIVRKGGDILHGVIHEVSLVLAGADPGARIDSIIEHGEESSDSAILEFVGFDDLYINHASLKKEDESSAEDSKTPEEIKKKSKEKDASVSDIWEEFSDEQKNAVAIIVGKMVEDQKKEPSIDHSDSKETPKAKEEATTETEPTSKEKTIIKKPKTMEDLLGELSEDQAKAVNVVIASIKSGKTDLIKGKKEVADALSSVDPEIKSAIEALLGSVITATKTTNEKKVGGNEMKHNAFTENGIDSGSNGDMICHADQVAIISGAKKAKTSLKDYIYDAAEAGEIKHAVDSNGKTVSYGIADIGYMFPDARTINNEPEMIKRKTEWVDKVMSAIHRTPFSRVKSILADITADEARARGYVKGNKKLDEVITLLKRVTEPQTIYKKQRFDKDDIDDITDFNAVAWVKTEMQMMLMEEIARACLIGDGRATSSDDKIKEDHIRPVINDDDLFTVKYPVLISATATDDEKAKALELATVKARKLYKGSGTPSFFTTEDNLTNSLMRENTIGERLYKSEAEVATALRAKEIVPVEPMDGMKIGITENSVTTQYDVAAVLTNMGDYNIGTNGGAKTDFFDDFDIDYNQFKYLYETRMSGALTKPYSAITFYWKTKA